MAGYILEESGGEDAGIGPYRPAMYFAGTLAFGSAVLFAVVRLKMQRDVVAES